MERAALVPWVLAAGGMHSYVISKAAPRILALLRLTGNKTKKRRNHVFRFVNRGSGIIYTSLAYEPNFDEAVKKHIGSREIVFFDKKGNQHAVLPDRIRHLRRRFGDEISILPLVHSWEKTLAPIGEEECMLENARKLWMSANQRRIAVVVFDTKTNSIILQVYDIYEGLIAKIGVDARLLKTSCAGFVSLDFVIVRADGVHVYTESSNYQTRLHHRIRILCEQGMCYRAGLVLTMEGAPLDRKRVV